MSDFTNELVCGFFQFWLNKCLPRIKNIYYTFRQSFHSLKSFFNSFFSFFTDYRFETRITLLKIYLRDFACKLFQRVGSNTRSVFQKGLLVFLRDFLRSRDGLLNLLNRWRFFLFKQAVY